MVVSFRNNLRYLSIKILDKYLGRARRLKRNKYHFQEKI
jgi:hypothetical protein